MYSLLITFSSNVTNISTLHYLQNLLNAQSLHRDRLNQTLFVLHFGNKTGIQMQSTSQANSFHDDDIFQLFILALDTCTQCGPIFSSAT